MVFKSQFGLDGFQPRVAGGSPATEQECKKKKKNFFRAALGSRKN